jgi:hypothetical protein
LTTKATITHCWNHTGITGVAKTLENKLWDSWLCLTQGSLFWILMSFNWNNTYNNSKHANMILAEKDLESKSSNWNLLELFTNLIRCW